MENKCSEIEANFVKAVEENFSLDLFLKVIEMIDQKIIEIKNPEMNLKLVILKANSLVELGKIKDAIDFLSSSNFPSANFLKEQFINEFKQIEYLLPKNSDKDKYENYMNWLKLNGAEIQKCKIVYYSSNYRGINSTGKIKNNEVIMRIPLKLIITENMGRETVIGKKIIANNLCFKFDYAIFCTIFHLEELYKNNSFWKPYLDMLPQDMSNFPIFFTEEEKKMLLGTGINEASMIISNLCEEEYNKIKKIAQEIEVFGLNQYLKMYILMSSRMFSLNIPPTPLAANVPFADMCNYNYLHIHQTCWEWCNSDKTFCVMAKRNIQRNQPIFESYGEKSNFNLLLYYGFIDQAVTKCKVILELPFLFKNFSERKQYYLNLNETQKCRYKFYNIEFNGRNKRNFYCLRFFFYEDDPDKLMKMNNNKWIPSPDHKPKNMLIVNPISYENEMKVLSTISNFIKKSINELDQNCTNETNILETTDISFNLKNILLLRKYQRCTFQYLSELCSAEENFLRLIKSEREKIINFPTTKFKEYLIPLLNL